MTAALRIVATAPVPPVARQAFAALGKIEVATEGDLATLRDADVLLVRSAIVSAAMIDAAPRLRAIARTGAGYDGIDLDAATARGIPVLVAPGAGTVPVAEGTLALVLAAAKRLNELSAMVRSGAWHERYEVETLDLKGAVLGIIGLGSIGREVARLGHAFGMTVVAHDPSFDPRPEHDFVQPVELADLFAGSDVVSVHCALTPRTRGMIDRELLRTAKRGAILVNVARGAILESDDVLLEALDRGWLAAVALDVYATEPPDPEHPLLGHPRVVCTPHSVGLTGDWSARVFGILAEEVARLVRGERPRHVVNPDACDHPLRAVG